MDNVTEYLEWIYPNPEHRIAVSYKPQPGSVYPEHHYVKQSVGKPCNYWGNTWRHRDDAIKGVEMSVNDNALAVWSSVHVGGSNAWGNKWSIGDVARIQFLAMDFDTVLPIGVQACSTDEELAKTAQHVKGVKRDLVDRGLPMPLHVETGNGHMLLFPIDLWVVDDLLDATARKGQQNVEMMKRLADCLAIAYDKPLVCTLDTGVLADPSRILGIVGTVNANKPEIVEDGRIARRRRVIGDYPDREPMAELEFIEWAEKYIAETEAMNPAKLVEYRSKQPPAPTNGPHQPVAPATDATIAAARKYADKCSPAIEGAGGDLATFQLAGNLLAFGLSEQQVFEAMENWNSQCSPPWDDDELRKKISSAANNGTPRAPKTLHTQESAEWESVANELLEDVPQTPAAGPVPPKKAATPLSTGETIVFESMADVVAKPIEWIWPGRLARGKLTLICGDPGKGKSFLSMDVSANVSTGSPFPDGYRPKIGTTILITDEDDSADTIKPRLMAMGADMTKIQRIKYMRVKDPKGKLQEVGFTLQLVKLLKLAIQQFPDVALIIIDPLMSYFGSAKSSDPAQVNALLGPLNEFASAFGVAVMALVHLNKDSKQSNALYRSMGSISVVGKARLAFLVAPDRNDPTKRILAQTKANAAVDCPSLAYSVQPTQVR